MDMRHTFEYLIHKLFNECLEYYSSEPQSRSVVIIRKNYHRAHQLFQVKKGFHYLVHTETDWDSVLLPWWIVHELCFVAAVIRLKQPVIASGQGRS